MRNQTHQLGDVNLKHLVNLLEHLDVQVVELCKVPPLQLFSHGVYWRKVSFGNLVLSLQSSKYLVQLLHHLLLLAVLPNHGHLLLQMTDDQSMHLGQSRSLDQIIQLPHGGKPGQSLSKISSKKNHFNL